MKKFLLLLAILTIFPIQMAEAKTCPVLKEGSLFKVPKNSTIYRISQDQKRDYFLNNEIFNTWYDNSRLVKVVDSQCVTQYEMGRGFNFRPGSRIVKTKDSPKIYAISTDGKKHFLSDTTITAQLYGKNWKKYISIIPDSLDKELEYGSEINTAVPHDGQIIKLSKAKDKYFVDEGTLVKLSEDKITVKQQSSAYKVILKDVREVTQEVFDSLPMSDGVIDADTIMKKYGFQISWNYYLATDVDDAYNFINGKGQYNRPRALSSIVNSPNGIYIFYREDLITKQQWGWKTGLLDDINDMLNAKGAYSKYNHKPIAQAKLLVQKDGYYIFYSGENNSAQWGWKRAYDLDDLKNFVNGLSQYPYIISGTISGTDTNEIISFYQYDKSSPKNWSFFRADSLDDLLNFLNGSGIYSNPAKQANIIYSSNSWYLFYK